MNKYKLSIVSLSGEILERDLNSKEVFRKLGIKCNPDNRTLRLFKSGTPRKVNNHFVIKTGAEEIVLKKISDLVEDGVKVLKRNLSMGVGSVIAKVNPDLSLIKVYSGGIVEVAKDCGKSVGTIKSRLHRDKKYVDLTMEKGSYCYTLLSGFKLLDSGKRGVETKLCPNYEHVESYEGFCKLTGCEIDNQCKVCGVKEWKF